MVCLNEIVIVIDILNDGRRYLNLGVFSVPFAEEYFLIKLTLLLLFALSLFSFSIFSLSRCETFFLLSFMFLK